MSETSTQNPLTVDVGEVATAQPCTLVIFGGSGDLSRRKLLPALYNLALDGVLPTNFAVLGFAMDDYDDERYRAFAHDGVAKFSRRPIDEQHWLDFERALFYVRGRFDDGAAFQGLKRRLEEIEPKFGIPGNRIFYLAIPPSLIGVCVQQLHAAGLVNREGEGPFTRVIVEKPIGHRPGQRPRDQRHARQGLRRAPDLPDRPLPRQGDRAEPDGRPVRQLDLRAALEPEVHRPCPDHGGRGGGGRHPRRATTRRRARCATWSRTTSCNCSA